MTKPDDPDVLSDEARRTLQRFAERVRLLRELRGLTQAQLATRSGLSIDFILQIERVECEVRLSAVNKIAVALSYEPTELVLPHIDDAMVVVGTPFDRSRPLR